MVIFTFKRFKRFKLCQDWESEDQWQEHEGDRQEEHEVQDDEQVGICGNEWDALGKNLIRRKKVIQFKLPRFLKNNLSFHCLLSHCPPVLWFCGPLVLWSFFEGDNFFSEDLSVL